MTEPAINFLSLDARQSPSYGKAMVAILPLPYEATVSYGKGTAKGPDAIISASTQVELYDEELGFEPCEVGVATLPPPDVAGLPPSKLREIVGPHVRRILQDGKFPIILGGEHSITPAVVGEIKDFQPGITVIQLDAHADLRQEYEGEKISHASAMSRVREVCPLVQLGIRSLSREEAEWISKDKLAVFFADRVHSSKHWISDVLEAVKTRDVYLTIDVDVFDISIMPATGTPEPGGLSWQEVTDFLRALAREKKVVGMDIVELAPIAGGHAYDFMVAKLAYKCIGYFCCK